jgi:hypothetical protein
MLSRNSKSFAIRWLALIAVLALGLSACGGDDGGEVADSGGSSGAATTPDTCSLLDTADVDAILGGSMDPFGSVSEDGSYTTCTWREPTSGASLVVNIWAAGSADDGWADSFVTSQSAAFETEEVSGPGLRTVLAEQDEAWYLYWNKDNAFVAVLAIVGETTASRADVIGLGEKVNSGF